MAALADWRSLTVVFCDLVGSTAVMRRIGEEAFAELLRDYYGLCTTVARRHGGQVAQYQGDGVICQFGFPSAAEDDASRAVAAALAIAADAPAIPVPPGEAPLQVRVGVATGRVRLAGGGREFGGGAVGACVNRAARLQALAPPGGVLACAATRRLAGEMFQYGEAVAATLEGFAAAEPVHRVLRRVRAPISRFEARRGRGETALVGRDGETALLLDRLAAAKAGCGSAALVAAPAGFGKSMLAHALAARPEAADCRTIVLQCEREHRDAALHPVREMVGWVAGAQHAEPAISRHQKIHRLLSVVWGATGPTLDGLLDLFSPLGAGAPPQGETTGALRRRLAFRELRRRFFRAGADKAAAILIVEDLHWADPSTLELIRGLADEIGRERALLIVTTRPGEGDPAPLGPAAATLALEPLSPADSADLARRLGADLPEALVSAIVARSEGVPLFLQEYAHAAAAEAERALASVPLSLDILIQSKLDALPPDARAFARIAAAFGPRFDAEEARAAAGLDAQAGEAARAALLAARLATTAPQAGRGDTAFSHALVRDAIYATLDASARRDAHSRIADALLRGGGAAAEGLEALAGHLALAGRTTEAVQTLLQAAGAAARGGSMAEARTHLERALEALGAARPGAERDRLELDVRAMEGPVLMVMRGPGSPAFGAAQERALALMRGLGLKGATHVIYNSALHAWARAELDRADAVAVEIEDDEGAGDAEGDGRGALARDVMQGLVAWHRGDNRLAAARMGAAAERYDPDRHLALYPLFLKDFGVFAQFYRALALTVMGEAAAGERAAETALALARAARLPHAVGFGLLARFNVAMLREEPALAAARAAEAEAFALQQGFPEFAAMAAHCLGWAAWREGRSREGLARMEDGAARWAATGFTTWRPLFAAERAGCLAAAGRTAQAAAAIAEAEAAVARSGEAQASAPLGLARARLLIAEGRPDAAAAAARAARATAERQGGALWRARADALLRALRA